MLISGTAKSLGLNGVIRTDIVPIWLLAVLVPIQFLINALGKAVEDVPSAWDSVIHVRD